MHWLLEGLSLCVGLVGVFLAVFVWAVAVYYLSHLLKTLLDLFIHFFIRWLVPPLLSMHLLLSGNITAFLLYQMR